MTLLGWGMHYFSFAPGLLSSFDRIAVTEKKTLRVFLNRVESPRISDPLDITISDQQAILCVSIFRVIGSWDSKVP